ncbi:MAG: hypothetical protein AAF456_17955 [Planctomycetota bacterium]
MLSYRPFLNTDPPLIVEIWRGLPQRHAIVEAVSPAILDEHIFAKPYFDRLGLVLAFEQQQSNVAPVPTGLIHAGFAPNDSLSDIDPSHGIISVMQVVEGPNARAVEDGLIQEAITYLKSRGAKRVSIGAAFPYAPFYSGMYGGSRVPGCLAEDPASRAAFERNGFKAAETVMIFTRSIAGFRPVVDRQQMAIRRSVQTTAAIDPIESTWWESCTLGMAQRENFKVHDKNNQLLASATFWDVQPLAIEWGVNARGLYNIKVADHDPDKPMPEGLKMYLMGESLKHLVQEGVSLVEVQTLETDYDLIAVLAKLGFKQSGMGTLMNREV